MKAFDIWFEEVKEDHPDISFDKINCGLTWMSALKWIQTVIEINSSCGELKKLSNTIKEELKISR